MQVARVRFKHSWGTAEKLYKSEAIDSFGNKYLLGVYETVKEAEKAFDEWNKEHPGRQCRNDELTSAIVVYKIIYKEVTVLVKSYAYLRASIDR